jgi:hypothetical protein
MIDFLKLKNIFCSAIIGSIIYISISFVIHTILGTKHYKKDGEFQWKNFHTLLISTITMLIVTVFKFLFMSFIGVGIESHP